MCSFKTKLGGIAFAARWKSSPPSQCSVTSHVWRSALTIITDDRDTTTNNNNNNNDDNNDNNNINSNYLVADKWGPH